MRSLGVRTRLLSTLILLSAIGGLIAYDYDVPAAQSALEIMQRQRELQRVTDEEETWLMKLVNKDGATKERRIVSYALTGKHDLSKLLVRFLAPRDVENTGLLTWEAKNGNDDQWLYLPATKRVKRIPAAGKKNRFMGTNFAFEDLRPENLQLHAYTFVGSERVEGWDCFVIEAAPATEKLLADSGYSKRTLWIRKDNYFTAKSAYYDKKGRLEKIATARQLVNVIGTIWRADEVEMRDVREDTKTIVVVESRAINRGLKESLFTEAALIREGL